VPQNTKKSNPQKRNLRKTNKQISIKTSLKTKNPQVLKKTATPQKNKPELVVKPQGWQHCLRSE